MVKNLVDGIHINKHPECKVSDLVRHNTHEERVEYYKNKLSIEQFNFLMENAGETPTAKEWRSAKRLTWNNFGLKPEMKSHYPAEYLRNFSKEG